MGVRDFPPRSGHPVADPESLIRWLDKLGQRQNIDDQIAKSAPTLADEIGIFSIADNAFRKSTLGVSSALTLLQTQIAGTSAAIDFTFSPIYDEYLLVISNYVPVTDNTELWVRVSEDSGATFKAGASDYRWQRNATSDAGFNNPFGSTGDTKMSLAPNLGNTNVTAGEIRFWIPAAGNNKAFQGDFMASQTGGGTSRVAASGRFGLDTNAINGIRILSSSGNISQGFFTLYALKKV